MADHDFSILPPPSPEHRRIAAGQFERANEVIASGNYDYGIQLLLTCCKLDPANLVFRQALRRTEKVKYKNNLRGSRLALLTTSPAKARIKAARRSRDYLRVLEAGEEVLARNPWDVGTQMVMAEAAEALGLLDLAVWTLEQARQKDAKHVALNRSLARLYEKRGNFTQAIQLWELVRKSDPSDVEAQHKAKDLAAHETITRGGYEEAIVSDSRAPLRPAGNREEQADEDLMASSGIRPVVPDRTTRETAPLLARIEAEPTDASAYLQLAAYYRRIGQTDQAREVLQQGLGPTGNDFLLAVELADMDTEPFRRNLAITDEKLRDDPQDEELKRIRIRLLKEINTRELDIYRQKAERYPNDTSQRLELGIRLLRAGQVDEAIVELQAARSEPRHAWRAFLYLGHCFKDRKNWRLAKRNFEEALQRLPMAEEPARKELLFQLAKGSADAGDLAAAIETAHELANLDFAYRDIGRLLDEWQARLQQA
jgi:tetratricopeptide (TPR) repeat protein